MGFVGDIISGIGDVASSIFSGSGKGQGASTSSLLSNSNSVGANESSSSNQGYDFLKTILGPMLSGGQSGLSGIQSLLGGDSTGFNSFKDATGFRQQLGRGLQGVTGAGAANGSAWSTPATPSASYQTCATLLKTTAPCARPPVR